MRENTPIHNIILPRLLPYLCRSVADFRALLFPAMAALIFLATGCHNVKTPEIEPIVLTDSVVAPAETVDSAALEAARKATIRAELEAKGLDRRIIVDKPHLKLFVVEKGDTLLRAGICCGAGRGDKTTKDDNKTPEGEFRIAMIQNSTDWLWNPGDGRPLVPHCYGPWFLRLDSPFHSIGIHGTGTPRSIGRRSSHGCIRVTNDNIRKLKELVEVGTRVTILPDRVNGPLIAKDATKPGSEAPETPADTTSTQPASPATPEQTAKESEIQPVRESAEQPEESPSAQEPVEPVQEAE